MHHPHGGNTSSCYNGDKEIHHNDKTDEGSPDHSQINDDSQINLFNHGQVTFVRLILLTLTLIHMISKIKDMKNKRVLALLILFTMKTGHL